MRVGRENQAEKEAVRPKRAGPDRGISVAARKRIAIEIIAKHRGELRRTARRYSLCEDDADDALQRGMEILLTKAPTDNPREMIRWTQTVVKHEALSLRRNRERLLAGSPAAAPGGREPDWVALIPAEGADPAERVERSEAIARSREALQSLKPQELRALTLLAEGYSYAEIGQLTGYSRTKINRCLAEGRDRFRRVLSSGRDGSRCKEMRPLLSTFCDGELGKEDAVTVREHLRACANCRSTMRAYRTIPATAAALTPGLPVSRSLLERAHEAFAGLYSRLPGQGGSTADSAMSQIAAAGGSRGAGMAALAKVLAICVGTAGGAAACVASGIAPAPIAPDHAQRPTLEKLAPRVTEALASTDSDIAYEPAPVEAEPPPQNPEPAPKPIESPEPAPSAAGGVEFTPEAAVAAAPPPTSASSSSGSAAGEFGP